MPVLTSVKVVQALSLRNGVLLLAFHHEGVVVVALDVIHVVLTQKHLPITCRRAEIWSGIARGKCRAHLVKADGLLALGLRGRRRGRRVAGAFRAGGVRFVSFAIFIQLLLA